VRLPGLFGLGLKKNLVYDLLHGTGYERNVNAATTFQFYDLADLWRDLQAAIHARLTTVNFATEPIAAADVAEQCFERRLDGTDKPVIQYDMRTAYASTFGRTGHYIRSQAEVLQQLQRFVALAAAAP
jgi:hypothetical protein